MQMIMCSFQHIYIKQIKCLSILRRILVTFLLKYFSNFSLALMTHWSHWLGRLLSSLTTWKAPSRLSPTCIFYTNKHTNTIFSNQLLHCWPRSTLMFLIISRRNTYDIKVLPVAPRQPRSGSAKMSCTWRACGQTSSQTRQEQGRHFKN